MSGFLPAGALSALRRVAASSMQTPCTILRKSSVSDGMGGNTDTWATLATTMCRVSITRGLSSEIAEQLRIEAINRFLISFPIGTDITPKDRIQTGDGTIFEIASVQEPRTYSPEVLCQVEQVVS